MYQPEEQSAEIEDSQSNPSETVYKASDSRNTVRQDAQPDCPAFEVYSSSDFSEEGQNPIPGVPTVHMSSDQDEETVSLLASDQNTSEEWSSDVASDKESQDVYPCVPCTKKEVPQRACIVKAGWYCQQCKIALCEGCKSYHDLFKMNENHILKSLHELCDPCKKYSNVDGTVASWYCNDCDEFLCEGCRSFHLQCLGTKKHICCSSYKKLTAQRTIPLRGCRARYLMQFGIRTPGDKETPCITDCGILTDSNLILVDRNNRKLKLFDSSKHELVEEKILDEVPRTFSIFDSSEIAVTTFERYILFFSLENACNFNLKRNVKLDIDCCGIAYIDKDRVAVTGFKPGSYYVYDTTGTEISKITMDCLGKALFGDSPYSIAINKATDRAYISDRDTFIVIDTKTNKHLFTYRHADLRLAVGLTLDQEGNVYVSGWESKNIHQVSPEGQLIQILQSKLYNLVALDFSSKNDTLIVGHKDGIVTMYKMDQSSEEAGKKTQDQAQCSLS